MQEVHLKGVNMAKIALWNITQSGPEKLREASIDLEKQLEDWIEKDLSLLQNGLRIVGRQITVEGGRLDLLALDPLGRWVVIELKAGVMFSDVIGQIMHYAASIAQMPYEELENKINAYLKTKNLEFKTVLNELGIEEKTLKSQGEREVLMMLVGTGGSEGLKGTLDYFSNKFKFPISLISFDMFASDEGIRILTRELTDRDIPQLEFEQKSREKYSIENIVSIADQSGIGPVFCLLLETAEKNGLFARPYANSIMFTPPQRHDRMLFTVWAKKRANNIVKTYIGSDVFAEFFPISEEKAISILGPIGWRDMAEKDISSFIESLNKLFEQIKEIKE
jgi:Holliday junction resolvase-like predicted endonuclease